MGWKDWSAWLKGGVIGGIIGILLFLPILIVYFVDLKYLEFYYLLGRTLGSLLTFPVFLAQLFTWAVDGRGDINFITLIISGVIYLIEGFIIGMLAGLIIGMIKNRN